VRRSAPLVFALLLVVALAATAPGQYKPEFKMSLVVGPAGPWGEGASVKRCGISHQAATSWVASTPSTYRTPA